MTVFVSGFAVRHCRDAGVPFGQRRPVLSRRTDQFRLLTLICGESASERCRCLTWFVCVADKIPPLQHRHHGSTFFLFLCCSHCYQGGLLKTVLKSQELALTVVERNFKIVTVLFALIVGSILVQYLVLGKRIEKSMKGSIPPPGLK